MTHSGTGRYRALTVSAAVISAALMIVGWHWDISWHRSIGRDTVWTLPHVAIYLSLATAFIYNAWLVLSHTFGARKELRAIKVLGFKGPSASFVALWAVLCQFTCVLFDDWWHGIYGLDIGVGTPPHYALAFGISFFYLGQFLYIAVVCNSAVGLERTISAWAATLVWSFYLGHLLIGMDPLYGHAGVRSSSFMISCALFVPFSLTLLPEFLQDRWSGVKSSALYAFVIILLMQVFMLFPATPQFGPVFHSPETFSPPLFPLLIFIPAAAMVGVGFLWRGKRGLLHYLVLGATYLVVFQATNWLSSGFLMSPAADNRFFAGGYPGSAFEPLFRPVPSLDLSGTTAGLALLSVGIAAISAWVGEVVGRWIRGLVR